MTGMEMRDGAGGPAAAAFPPEAPEPNRKERPEGSERSVEERREALLTEVQAALDEDRLDTIGPVLESLHAADLAALLEQLHPDDRGTVVGLLRSHLSSDAEVLTYLNEDVREQVMHLLKPEELASGLAELDSDDALTVIEDLDAAERERVLASLPRSARRLVEEGLTYPEDSAGRLMQREFVAVPMFWTVGRVIDWFRETEDLPEDFYSVFVVDPMHRPIGAAPLSRILRSKRPVKIEDLVSEEVRPIPATMDQEEVAFLFQEYDMVSAPVVDGAGRLIGVITVDDVVDVIDEEAEHDLLRLGGVQQDDLYRALIDTSRSRFSWLFVNLITAIVASSVIALFEGTIQHVVALAVLMPIVASMGGNAGTQTLTVAVRGLATRELDDRNAVRFLWKEVLVGGINGVLFAVIAGGIAALWFGNLVLGLVIGAAMIVNLVAAGFAGMVIPLVLHRLGVDPAVSSTVFLTTVTDVVGFFAFLGLAAWILL